MQNQDLKEYKLKEYIRMRPAMYIGDLRFTGFKHMLQYFFEEIICDCFENPVFEIDFFPKNRFTIKISNINTQRFLLRLDDLEATDYLQRNLGVGVFITLNSDISIAVNNLPFTYVLMGQRGNYETVASTSQEKENNVIIDYTVDNSIFKDYELVYEQINSFLRQFALLNPNLKIISIDHTSDDFQRNVFHYPTGIFKQLDYFLSEQPFVKPLLRLDIDAQIGAFSYKIGICYSNIWLEKSFIRTYAENIETFLGGSLNDGIFDGLILSIKTLARRENADILINKRLATEHLVLIASVKGENLVYTGSVKIKLGMPQLRKDVKKIVFDQLTNYFQSNPKIAESILHKFQRWD